MNAAALATLAVITSVEKKNVNKRVIPWNKRHRLESVTEDTLTKKMLLWLHDLLPLHKHSLYRKPGGRNDRRLSSSGSGGCESDILVSAGPCSLLPSQLQGRFLPCDSLT